MLLQVRVKAKSGPDLLITDEYGYKWKTNGDYCSRVCEALSIPGSLNYCYHFIEMTDDAAKTYLQTLWGAEGEM